VAAIACGAHNCAGRICNGGSVIYLATARGTQRIPIEPDE